MGIRLSDIRLLFALALPMVLARATQTVITFADVFQVKHLGDDAIAATATGGLNTFGLIVLPMGIAFIIQSFVSQLVGAGRRDDAPRFAWYGLAIAALSAVVAFAAIPFVSPVLGVFGYAPHVHDEMSHYLAIRLLSVGAVVGTEALGNYYGGLGNTYMQMIAGIITMALAILFNWFLIAGHAGFAPMGVAGAAVASVIASWAGFVFLLVALWRKWGGAPRGSRKSLGLSFGELRRVMRFGFPNGINWFLEFSAFQLFVNGVFGSLGTHAVAGFNIVLAVNSVAFMPAFGLASAGAILAGQAIGRNERDRVVDHVKATLIATIGWMATIAAIYVIAPRAILSLFAEGPDRESVIALGSSMLIVSAGWQLFDATQMTLAETLRAAGDTRWTAIVRMILAWGLFMPGAFAIVHFGGGGPIAAMLCLGGYLALLAAALFYRFRSGAWRSITLIEPQLI